MSHFPVTSSNLSALHLGQFLQNQYSLTDATHCSLLRSGINDTYRVKDGSNQFIFRVYSLNWRTREEIGEEIRLLNRLRQHGVSVSYPIADSQGQFIQVLNAPEGDRFGVLFSYAPGQKIHNLPEETHHRAGVLMARLHQVTAGLKLRRVDYTPSVLLVEPLSYIRQFLSEDSPEMDFLLSTQSYLLKELPGAEVNQRRTGIVHLDIWFDNLNVTADNEITLFDFDFCGNGWLCLDMAYYIMQLHNIERYEKTAYQPKIDSFLRGYESVTSISEEEKRLIPLLGVTLNIFYLGIQCRRYDNWSNAFLSEDYLKRFINGIIRRYLGIIRENADAL